MKELRIVVVPAEIQIRHLSNITRTEACRDVLDLAQSIFQDVIASDNKRWR
jgi:hypothetical protein